MKRLQKQNSVGVKQNPQLALINSLNREKSGGFVSTLVEDAKSTVDVLSGFATLNGLLAAKKQGKLPKNFWKTYERLNATLREFARVPEIDATFFYDAERVSWNIPTNAPPIEYFLEVGWVLQLLAQGTLNKIRRCEHCQTWYAARLAHQRFCMRKCRWNAFAQDPEFKEERRAAERERYRLHVSGKVTSKTSK